jgi:uncharacterized protein (DUF1778 family)
VSKKQSVSTHKAATVRAARRASEVVPVLLGSARMKAPAKSEKLEVRVSPKERDLLEQAAENSKTNLSEFVRRKALEAAEMDLFQRTVVTIPAGQWDAFEAFATAPARHLPGLAALAKRKLTWNH